jgi:hypothetical protein
MQLHAITSLGIDGGECVTLGSCPLYLGAGAFDILWTLVSVYPKAAVVKKKNLSIVGNPNPIPWSSRP